MRYDTFAEQQEKESQNMHYSFTLFVISGGENSKRAQKNLKHLCQKWLPGRHEIEVVDVLQDFQTALDHNILLTPSVVVTKPEPQVTIHGDLSDAHKFVEILNLNGGEADEI